MNPSTISEGARGLRRSLRTRIAIALGVSVVFLGVCLLFFLTLPDPRVRTIFKGKAEIIRVIALIPEVAGFRVGRMKAIPDDADDGPCIDGLARPAQGVQVTYLRVDKGFLRIDLAFPNAAADDRRPTAFLDMRDGRKLSLAGPHRLVEVEETICPGLPPKRLAIQGDAVFGRELLPASAERDSAIGHLSEGKIVMFGQSVDRLFGGIPVQPRIYSVEEIELPAGSRVGARSMAVDDARPVWWGIAQIDPNQRGFSIDASTNARRVLLVMPGSERAGETIEVGDFFQLTEDPTVFWVFIGLAALATGLLSAIGAGAWQQIRRWFRRLWRDVRAAFAPSVASPARSAVVPPVPISQDEDKTVSGGRRDP